MSPFVLREADRMSIRAAVEGIRKAENLAQATDDFERQVAKVVARHGLRDWLRQARLLIRWHTRQPLFRLGRWLLSFEYVAAQSDALVLHDQRVQIQELTQERDRLRIRLSVVGVPWR